MSESDDAVTKPRGRLLQRLLSGEQEWQVSNAAGTVKHAQGVIDMVRSLPAGRTVTVGSYRLDRYDGNPGVTEHFDAWGGINYKGIPTSADFDEFCRETLPLRIMRAGRPSNS